MCAVRVQNMGGAPFCNAEIVPHCGVVTPKVT